MIGMIKRLLIFIGLIASLQCFAQSVIISDTKIKDITFRKYSYDFTCNEFSKNINFTLPMPCDNAILQTITDDLLQGEYDCNTLEEDLKKELLSYLDNKKSDEVKTEDYYETSWSIVPVFVDGGYIAFVSSFLQKFAGDVPAPMWGDKCSVFSLSTGNRITEEDIFGKDSEQIRSVERKLYSTLCKILKKSDDEKEDVSFLFNDNFYFTSKELIFKYGSFEMYFTSGVTELSLPKKWLKPYLNVDGPLYQYWFGEKK